MEAAPVGAIQYLVRAIAPIAVIAACVGLVTIGSALLALYGGRGSSPEDRSREAQEAGSAMEKIAAIVCALLAVLGLVSVVQLFRYREATPGFPTLAVVFSVALLTLSLPALLWKTRARLLGEGIATIGVAVASFVSAFSIGVLFIPVVMLMIWECGWHLFNEIERARRARSIAV
jgi:cytochrome bd-type quinol oxidase subunit 2